MNQYYDPSAAAAYAQAAAMATGGAAAANYEGGEEEEGEEGEDGSRPANSLTTWGNANNMNLNPLIFTNITSSPYFKVTLIQFKTYHEVIDEIYYKVDHLEPWERGSRKTAGQTGMCGGVRGVGAGGIVSSAFCLLFKLFTLKLTRKQVVGLLNHCDSPYIRGVGFMYIRYCLPPAEMWDWFEDYLDDEEEIDVKAGGGKSMTIGEMVMSFMTKLEWFDTRFPRIPVNVQKTINDKIAERRAASNPQWGGGGGGVRDDDRGTAAATKSRRSPSPDRRRDGGGSSRRDRSRSRDRRDKKHRSRSRSRDRRRRSRSRDRKRDRRSRSRDRKDRKRDGDYSDELRKYSEHRNKKHKKHRSRSRSRSPGRRR